MIMPILTWKEGKNMNKLDEQAEIRDRDIGQKILKLKQLGVLALDTSISAFAAKDVSRFEVMELADKVARMTDLLEQIEFGIPHKQE
jgi:hypothetical protein